MDDAYSTRTIHKVMTPISEACDSKVQSNSFDPSKLEAPNEEQKQRRNARIRWDLPKDGPAGQNISASHQFKENEKLKYDGKLRLKTQVERNHKLAELLRFSKTFKSKTPTPKDVIHLLDARCAKQQALVDSIEEEVLSNRVTEEDVQRLKRQTYREYMEADLVRFSQTFKIKPRGPNDILDSTGKCPANQENGSESEGDEIVAAASS